MRLAFSPLAERDLEAIADYIAANNPTRALSFIRELRTMCSQLAQHPQGYRLRPELGEGIRSCAHGRYVIFFEIAPGGVAIVRILHGARDLPAMFDHDD